MRKSVPVQMESVAVLNVIQGRSGLAGFFNLLNNFNIGLTLTLVYMLSTFGMIVFAFLFNEFVLRVRSERRRKIRISKRIALAVRSFAVKRLSAIGLFVLFVHLFFWFTQLFLSSNIKTNKVVRLLSTQIKSDES